MTFKAAVAGLPLGGGKGVIAPGARRPLAHGAAAARRAARLRRHGRRRSAAATSRPRTSARRARDMTVIAEHTAHVTGLSRRARRLRRSRARSRRSASRRRSARRCERAVRQRRRCRAAASRCIGLGHVGGRAGAPCCAAAGARLVVTDVDPGKRALADELGARWVDARRARSRDGRRARAVRAGRRPRRGDGPALRAASIAGAANNQLADDAVAEAARRARRSCGRPTSSSTPAGSSTSPSSSSRRLRRRPRAAPRAARSARRSREIFDDAERRVTTPLAAALALARRRLTAAA